MSPEPSGGHTEVVISVMPLATNAPPAMIPRDRSRGGNNAAIGHAITPSAIRMVPVVLRGRAVLSDLSARPRRLRILNLRDVKPQTSSPTPPAGVIRCGRGMLTAVYAAKLTKRWTERLT